MARTFDVPETPPRRRPLTVPPRGWHDATVHAAALTDEGLSLIWQFTAERRRWRQAHVIEGRADMSRVLIVLGFAGRQVTAADIPGAAARIKMRTRGNRASAEVADVQPPTGA